MLDMVVVHCISNVYWQGFNLESGEHSNFPFSDLNLCGSYLANCGFNNTIFAFYITLMTCWMVSSTEHVQTVKVDLVIGVNLCK